MKFDFIITLKKGVLGFLTGLAGVIVAALIQALTNYNPTICSAEITDNCTPQYVYTLYMAIIPVITGFLVGIANWLKNKNNG